MGWQMAASGYAAVWATENTREAIFDAMMRRETYATTGPRMLVKFDADYGDQSVPMGGELFGSTDNKGPTFSMRAWKDPLGANLDRIQIVKGWLDQNGDTQEAVVDVRWSGDRSVGADGKLDSVGSTVDVKTATYENSIGAASLQAQWQDPDFDTGQSAFYYMRVLEIPTPRWTSYDSVRFNETIDDEDVPMTTQERAYTSPIWFNAN